MSFIGKAPFFESNNGKVSRDEILGLSAELEAWNNRNAAMKSAETADTETIRFLESNTRRFSTEGAEERGAYVSSLQPDFTDPIDAVLGKVALTKAIYSHGMSKYLDIHVDFHLIREDALKAHKFAFSDDTIEYTWELVRRARNPVFQTPEAEKTNTLTAVTKRFYAGTDSKDAMKLKAVSMVNLGLWSASPRGTGYAFSSGPVLNRFMENVFSTVVAANTELV